MKQQSNKISNKYIRFLRQGKQNWIPSKSKLNHSRLLLAFIIRLIPTNRKIYALKRDTHPQKGIRELFCKYLRNQLDCFKNQFKSPRKHFMTQSHFYRVLLLLLFLSFTEKLDYNACISRRLEWQGGFQQDLVTQASFTWVFLRAAFLMFHHS